MNQLLCCLATGYVYLLTNTENVSCEKSIGHQIKRKQTRKGFPSIEIRREGLGKQTAFSCSRRRGGGTVDVHIFACGGGGKSALSFPNLLLVDTYSDW